MTRPSTAWKPYASDRVYRGWAIFVSKSFKGRWYWSSGGANGTGYAKTLAAAQRAAERAVDAALARAKGAK